MVDLGPLSGCAFGLSRFIHQLLLILLQTRKVSIGVEDAAGKWSDVFLMSAKKCETYIAYKPANPVQSPLKYMKLNLRHLKFCIYLAFSPLFPSACHRFLVAPLLGVAMVYGQVDEILEGLQEALRRLR